MKITFALLAVVLAISACSKTDAPATTAATPAVMAPAVSAPAAAAPVVEAPAAAATPTPVAASTTAAATDLPKECQDYIDKVTACVSKQGGPAADAIKSSMDQTKAAWASMGSDKSALAAACKATTDAFAAQASMMKC